MRAPARLSCLNSAYHFVKSVVLHASVTASVAVSNRQSRYEVKVARRADFQ